jgi:hypothetical protein
MDQLLQELVQLTEQLTVQFSIPLAIQSYGELIVLEQKVDSTVMELKYIGVQNQ